VTVSSLRPATTYSYSIAPAPGCGSLTGTFTTEVNID
jgi:hypothetical protein